MPPLGRPVSYLESVLMDPRRKAGYARAFGSTLPIEEPGIDTRGILRGAGAPVATLARPVVQRRSPGGSDAPDIFDGPTRRRGGGGKPLGDLGVARRDVNAIIRPLIAEIQRSIDSRTKAGAGAITGYTSALAQALAPYQERTADIYGRAQQAQAASDAALTSGLRTGSNQAADELAGRLAALPGAEAHAETARDTGQGAAGALAGTGSASLSELIASGAAAEAYADKLPEFARLGGLDAIRDLTLQSRSQLADELGGIRSQVPQLVQGRLDTLAERRQAESELAESRRQFNVGQKAKAEAEAFRRRVIAEELGIKAAGLDLDAKKLDAKIAQDIRDTKIKLAELGVRKADLQRKANESMRDYRLRVAKMQMERNQWLAEHNIDLAKLEQAERKLKLAGKKGGWTKKEIAERRMDVADSIREAFEGYKDKDTGELIQKPYATVARDLVAAGYPLSMVSRIARAYWRPGAPGVERAIVNGVIYLYRPDVEEPDEGMPVGYEIGVRSQAGGRGASKPGGRGR